MFEYHWKIIKLVFDDNKFCKLSMFLVNKRGRKKNNKNIMWNTYVKYFISHGFWEVLIFWLLPVYRQSKKHARGQGGCLGKSAPAGAHTWVSWSVL